MYINISIRFTNKGKSILQFAFFKSFLSKHPKTSVRYTKTRKQIVNIFSCITTVSRDVSFAATCTILTRFFLLYKMWKKYFVFSLLIAVSK